MGFSSSTDFPTTAGAFDRTANGGFDGTLTKLNPAGSALVYSTYLGGSGFDSGGGVAVDGAGNAYVAGDTAVRELPHNAGAYDTTYNNGDGYVTKLNPAGSALVYSTFVGGSAGDNFSGIVLDPAGNSWLTGSTNSTDFPVTAGAPDPTFNGGWPTPSITELNAAGSALLFATFLGGSQSESGYDIARDATAATSTSPASPSRRTSRPPSARSTLCSTATRRSSGVTPSSRRSTSTRPRSHRQRHRAFPAAPTLVSPSNASSQPQPISFDWNDVPEAVVVHHPDRRLERVHRTPGPRHRA